MGLLGRPAEPPPGKPAGTGDDAGALEVLAVVDDEAQLADGPGGRLDPAPWGALARAVLEEEGVTGPAELALRFVDEAAIAALNEAWLGEPGPTDVLSFPLDADEAPRGGVLRLLGDVVICPAVARRYAAEHGRRPEDELALLVVHGVLHVLGHDHADAADEAAMQAREDHHLRRHHDPAWARSRS